MKSQIKALLLFSFMIVSCKVTESNAATVVSQNNPLILLTLKENSLASYSDFSLVNSNEELWKIYGVLNQTRMPGLRAPEVDFNTNSLLLVNINLDRKKYSDITLDSLQVSRGQLQVRYRGNNGNPDMLGIPNSYRVIKLIKIEKATSISKIEELK